MGLPFQRPYLDILRDMSKAIQRHEGCNEWFGMPAEEWAGMSDEERNGYTTTFADDILYGLGGVSQLTFGTCSISYNRRQGVIRLRTEEDQAVHIIFLQ